MSFPEEPSTNVVGPASLIIVTTGNNEPALTVLNTDEDAVFELGDDSVKLRGGYFLADVESFLTQASEE